MTATVKLSPVLLEVQRALKKDGRVRYERGVREPWSGRVYRARSWETFTLCKRGGTLIRTLTRAQVLRAAQAGLLVLPKTGLPRADLFVQDLVLFLSANPPVQIGKTAAMEVL